MVLLSSKKTSPDQPYCWEELIVAANRLFNTSVAANALISTLSPLITYIPDRDREQYLVRLAYAIAGRSFELSFGNPVSVWAGSVAPEWCLQEVLSIAVKDDSFPLALQDCDVTTKILSGSAAGCHSVRTFSRKALAFLAPKLGFAKISRVNRPNGKPIKHPRFNGPQDLIGLMWYGLISPGESYPPKYFEVKCTPSIMNRNRSIVERARNASRDESGGRVTLVQPSTGHGAQCTSDMS